MEKITSRQNEKIRQTAFLKKRSERQSSRMFFFEGFHLAEEFLRFGHEPEYVFVTPDASGEALKLFEKWSDRVYEVPESVYEKITDERAPQGVLCVSRFLPNIKKSDPVSGSIVLESLQDNGNVGTVIRTAASLGIAGVALSADCADIYSPKTIRATMGALFSTDIAIVEDVPQAVGALRKNGSRVFAALLDENSKKLGEFGIMQSDCFIIGNEGRGVSRETAEACDGGVFIPMSGRTESLNASAAAAILLWEMKKSGNG